MTTMQSAGRTATINEASFISSRNNLIKMRSSSLSTEHLHSLQPNGSTTIVQYDRNTSVVQNGALRQCRCAHEVNNNTTRYYRSPSEVKSVPHFNDFAARSVQMTEPLRSSAEAHPEVASGLGYNTAVQSPYKHINSLPPGAMNLETRSLRGNKHSTNDNLLCTANQLGRKEFGNVSYELSEDLRAKEIEFLERCYGGRLRAQRAARVIQKSYRNYRMKREYARIRCAKRVTSYLSTKVATEVHSPMNANKINMLNFSPTCVEGLLSNHSGSLEDLVLEQAYVDWAHKAAVAQTNGDTTTGTDVMFTPVSIGHRNTDPPVFIPVNVSSLLQPELNISESGLQKNNDAPPHTKLSGSKISCTQSGVPKADFIPSSHCAYTGQAVGNFTSYDSSCRHTSHTKQTLPDCPNSSCAPVNGSGNLISNHPSFISHKCDPKFVVCPPHITASTVVPQQHVQPVQMNNKQNTALQHLIGPCRCGTVISPGFVNCAQRSRVVRLERHMNDTAFRRATTSHDLLLHRTRIPTDCSKVSPRTVLVTPTSSISNRLSPAPNSRLTATAPHGHHINSPLQQQQHILQFTPTGHPARYVITPSYQLPQGPLSKQLSHAAITSSKDQPISPSQFFKQQAYSMERRRKRIYRIGLNLFNKCPTKGIEFLIRYGFLDGTPEGLARFLLCRRGLSRVSIGDYLGNTRDELANSTTRQFMHELDFRGLEVDEALRLLLGCFRIPGESQKISHLMNEFQMAFVEQNPIRVKSQFRNSDSVMVLAYAIVMLHTDMYSPNIRSCSKMTRDEFVRNLRGVDAGQDLDSNQLLAIYDRIRQGEMSVQPDHTDQVRKIQQHLTGPFRPLNLALPQRRLVCYCRLYEVPDKSKRERPGAHQREVFLFNDLLLITKSVQKKRRDAAVAYQVRISLSLFGVRLCLFETTHHPYGIDLLLPITDNAHAVQTAASLKQSGLSGPITLTADGRARILISLNTKTMSDRTRFVDDLQECILEVAEMDHVRLETEMAKQVQHKSGNIQNASSNANGTSSVERRRRQHRIQKDDSFDTSFTVMSPKTMSAKQGYRASHECALKPSMFANDGYPINNCACPTPILRYNRSNEMIGEPPIHVNSSFKAVDNRAPESQRLSSDSGLSADLQTPTSQGSRALSSSSSISPT